MGRSWSSAKDKFPVTDTHSQAQRRTRVNDWHDLPRNHTKRPYSSRFYFFGTEATGDRVSQTYNVGEKWIIASPEVAFGWTAWNRKNNDCLCFGRAVEVSTLFSFAPWAYIKKNMSETAAKLSAIFEAIKTQRGVYLLDEIDALAASRDNASDVGEARRILNSFLQFLDEDTGPSIVVATTNLPEILDRALLRRFDIVLPYDFPTAHSIKLAMSRRLLAFDVKDVQWDQIVGHASGLSASDVIQAATDAARRAVLRSREKISTKELVQSINRRKELQELTSAVGRPK